METQRFPQNLLTAIFLSTEKDKNTSSSHLSNTEWLATLFPESYCYHPRPGSPFGQASAVTFECPHIPACHLSSQVLIIKQREKANSCPDVHHVV